MLHRLVVLDGEDLKLPGITSQRQLAHLLPALCAAAFVFICVILLLVFYIVVPYWVYDTKYFWWIDSEAARMWVTLAFLFIAWATGMYGFSRFIEKPKPDEIQID